MSNSDILEDIETLLRNNIQGIDSLSVKEWSVDGSHFAVKIKASEFNGYSPIKMHRRIYDVIGESYVVGGEDIHALHIDAKGTGE